jgi:DNA repair protein RadC
MGVVFPSVPENTMSLTLLDREQLENQLLADPMPRPHCLDSGNAAAPAYFEDPGYRRTLLRHRLAVARELLLRDAQAELANRDVVNSPSAARDYLRLHFANLTHEVFIVVFLDAQNRVIACEEMFRGTLTQTSVYPREVVRAALAHNAATVLLAHNHPSGLADPSRSDEALTKALRSALSLVDVRVIDHLVCAAGRIVSFAERGLI